MAGYSKSKVIAATAAILADRSGLTCGMVSEDLVPQVERVYLDWLHSVATALGIDDQTVHWVCIDRLQEPDGVWLRTMGTSKSSRENILKNFAHYNVSVIPYIRGRVYFIPAFRRIASLCQQLREAGTISKPPEPAKGGLGRQSAIDEAYTIARRVASATPSASSSRDSASRGSSRDQTLTPPGTSALAALATAASRRPSTPQASSSALATPTATPHGSPGEASVCGKRSFDTAFGGDESDESASHLLFLARGGGLPLAVTRPATRPSTPVVFASRRIDLGGSLIEGRE